jgi:c-di-GMP-binding flagellar brake protein YcgR
MESATEMLGKDDVPIGTPLAWSLLDRDGTLLLERGATLTSHDERAFLFEHFRPSRGDLPLAHASDAPSPSSSHANAFTSADMDLASGMAIGLRPRLSGGQSVRSGRLIGVAPNRALFVAWSTTRPPVELARGEQVELVTVSRRAVFWCVCTVEAVCNDTLDYLVLSEPGNIRRLRMRGAVRARVHIPVRYERQSREQGECDGLSLARDLSTQGMSLAAPAPLGPVGGTVHVAFRLTTNELDVELRLHAVIRSVKGDASGTSTMHGLEFKGLQASEHLALKAFVLERAYASTEALQPLAL